MEKRESEIIKKDQIKNLFPAREKEAKKYDFGYLIIIGGSQLYSGSPALAAMAALRTGVDLTLIVAPERSADIIASFSPNLIAYPLKGHDLGKDHLPILFSLIESAKKVAHGKVAVLIGGGLGRDDETQEAIREFLSQIEVPCVIDADAIWAIAPKKEEILPGKKFILTPHKFEFYVLSGKDVSAFSLEEKIKTVSQFAQSFKTTILLKGNPDIITNGEKTALNQTGCPEMTVGGTGDVLAGICGALLSQGFDEYEVAKVGAFISGKAGELAREEFSVGLLATDVIEKIPKVLKSFKI